MKRTLLVLAIGSISAALAGGVLAQESGSNTSGGQSQGSGQAAGAVEMDTEKAEMPQDSEGQMEDDQASQASGQEPASSSQSGSGNTSQAGGGQDSASSQLDESIRHMQASELEGMTVINQEDEEIGDVKNVVKDDQSGELFVVVTVGGFWGLGGDEIALPLSDIQIQEDQLQMQTTYGEDQIEESANEYDEERYSEVDGETTLDDA
ncbi:PRC-barrel domain-containing protein [Litchfieldella xinjiangensis]|uniref:PRC-barrel domain-containing protein n=1 Tax=Litchfieldella xinjiangensis TaxID=1166948 RepID=UPI0005B9EE16|nr:PRC-barrel domain-containing protein [Halomonas xinjiangensis]